MLNYAKLATLLLEATLHIDDFTFELYVFFAVPTVQVEALVGSTTKLPCQMNSTRSSDAVFLVLWYVDLDGKPIYR